MIIRELVDLKQYTTFRMGPKARFFAVVEKEENLHEAYAFAKEINVPVVILGSGSNVLLKDNEILEALVLKIEIHGFEVIEETDVSVSIRVGAGEIWDSFVKRAVEMNFSGVETLSGIPGTVGATPVQNVGAYGSEIKDALVSLEAYEIATGKLITLTKEECRFAYRDSIFKNEAKGKFLITSVTFKLLKTEPKIPAYAGVSNYFEKNKIAKPTLLEIRQAILEIRQQKLPDPKNIASVGSFFKNPIINYEQYSELKKNYPNAVTFSLDDGSFKVSAGWLLENLGLKGQEFSHLQFYSNNALVLVNDGSATFLELEKLVKTAQSQVQNRFGIELEMEPNIIGNN